MKKRVNEKEAIEEIINRAKSKANKTPKISCLIKNKKRIMIPVIALSAVMFVFLLTLSIITDSLPPFVFSVIFFVISIFFYSLFVSTFRHSDKSDEERVPTFVLIALMVIGMGGFGVVTYFLILPPLTFQSASFVTYLLMNLILIGLFISYVLSKYVFKTDKLIFKRFLVSFKSLSLVSTISVLTITCLYGIVGSLLGADAFRAKDLSALINVEKVEDDDIINENFSYEDSDILLPMVDKAISYREAQTALGVWGNQYYINSDYFSIQAIKEDDIYRLVRVSPLEYSNLFISLQKNLEGTPGYVLVDLATGVASLHTEKKIVYTGSSKLATDLRRHFRTNNLFDLYDNFYFEIDDDYNPYWIIPCYKKKIGVFNGRVPSKVITLDAVTGKMTSYAINDAPEWIDNVIDVHIAADLAQDALRYKDGYINATFGAKNDVYSINDGYNYFYNNGTPYYVSSVTSPDIRDQTSIGFLTISMRDMETDLYIVPGITEGRAMDIARLDGEVIEKKLTATWPVFLDIKGTPSFFLTLKNSVKVQYYAFLDQTNGSVVSLGSTLEEAYQGYLKKLGMSNDLAEKELIIDRINFIDNQAYILFEGIKEIYRVNFSLDSRITILQTGDRIKFNHFSLPDADGYLSISSILQIALN